MGGSCPPLESDIRQNYRIIFSDFGKSSKLMLAFYLLAIIIIIDSVAVGKFNKDAPPPPLRFCNMFSGLRTYFQNQTKEQRQISRNNKMYIHEMLLQVNRNFRLIREPFTSALIKRTELIPLESKYIIVQHNSIAQGTNK